MKTIPENFVPTWQRASRRDSVPTRQISRDDPAALRQLTDSLLAFAAGGGVRFVSALATVWPEDVLPEAIADMLRRHVDAEEDLLACLPDRPERVWAMIEEEHFWLLFEDA